MAKSKPKFIYGIDEPGRLSKKKFNEIGYLLVRKSKNGKKAFLADFYKNKYIWDADQTIDFHEHSVEKLLNFFRKLPGDMFSNNRTEIEFLEIEVKKSFYEELLDDEE
jgi:hypothetical protein